MGEEVESVIKVFALLCSPLVNDDIIDCILACEELDEKVQRTEMSKEDLDSEFFLL